MGVVPGIITTEPISDVNERGSNTEWWNNCTSTIRYIFLTLGIEITHENLRKKIKQKQLSK